MTCSVCWKPDTRQCLLCSQGFCGIHYNPFCELCSPETALNPPPELRGIGVSNGLARGTARVLRTRGEANRLQPGEVLVARNPGPAWTPLFVVPCAVVTEIGGVLESTALVAREYGIPAVFGVLAATRLIRDGQLVEVDGDAGVVRLISEQSMGIRPST